MNTIYLSDNLKRDALVNLEPKSARTKVNYLLDDGRKSKHVRMIKATKATSFSALLNKAGELDKIADILVEGDPEIDFAATGRFVECTRRVFLDSTGKIAYSVRFMDVIRNPDGSEKEMKAHVIAEQNVATEVPVKWTDKFFPKEKAISMFAFTRKYQVTHINGLTYDFLYNMAKTLDEKKAVVLIGAGPKGAGPLILSRGAKPYRGFLEGRVNGDKYCLILHLSNLELKEA